MLTLSAGLVLTAHLLVLLSPALLGATEVQGVINLLPLLSAATLRINGHRRPFCLLLVFCVALLSATLQAGKVLEDRLKADLDGQVLAVEGVVASAVRRHERSISFILQDARFLHLASRRLPARIKVSWFQSARLPAPGERWTLALRLRAPRGTLNPGGFDEEAWMFRERIGATASVVNGEVNSFLGQTGSQRILRLRVAISARIENELAGHPARGLVSGLATGLRHDISSAQWQTLSDTGTGHLVAISGLHVGLVAGFVFALVRLCWGLAPGLAGRIAPIDAAWLPSLIAAFVYALLAGFAMPTRRALLMLALWFGARALRRPVRPANLISLALIGSLAMDGLSMLGPGFWLSFVAVTTIYMAARAVTRSGPPSIVPLQGLVFTGLAPVTFAAFGKLPLISPLANLVTIPFFSFLVIPLVLVYLAMSGLWPTAAALLLNVPAWLISQMWPLLEYLAGAEALVWRGPGESAALFAGLLLIGLVGLAPRWAGKSVLLCVLALSVLFARPVGPPRGGIDVTVLDVGHGLAVILRTRRHALLYDAGPGRGSTGTAEQVIAPAMYQMGVQRPDMLVLSHDDASHVSGAAAMLKRYPGATIVTGAPLAIGRRLASTYVHPCAAGQAWQWDGVSFAMLQPGREIIWEDNDSSCVLQVTAAGMRLLITGDLTRRGEQRLLQRYPHLRADVVVGLNHGSKTASSPELVSSVGAGLVIFSTSWKNAWGLPDAAVIRRWRDYGAVAVDTGSAGAVRIRAGWTERDWCMTRMRVDERRLWRAATLR